MCQASVFTNLSSKFDRFLHVRSQFDTNHRVNLSTPTFLPTYPRPLDRSLFEFVLCFLRQKIKKEFRIATVAIFRCDLYAAVSPQMSPPPPTKNCARLRTTSYDYPQLSTMVNFIVLSIKLVCMVLGISYSRVLAHRPTDCCSASRVQ